MQEELDVKFWSHRIILRGWSRQVVKATTKLLKSQTSRLLVRSQVWKKGQTQQRQDCYHNWNNSNCRS